MGSDADVKVTKYVKKYKKRMKRILCCGVIWWLLGILSLVLGIVFLVKFTEFWGDETTYKRHIAYAGLGLLLASLVLIGIGIALCVTLYILYKRMSASNDRPAFVHRKYAYGEAPYPQQPPMDQQPMADPSAPPPDGSPAKMLPPGGAPYPVDQSAVNVEVSDHHKF